MAGAGVGLARSPAHMGIPSVLAVVSEWGVRTCGLPARGRGRALVSMDLVVRVHAELRCGRAEHREAVHTACVSLVAWGSQSALGARGRAQCLVRLSPRPRYKGKYCVGERKRFRLCNLQACPPGHPSFRQQQCSRFDTVWIETKQHTWVPVANDGERLHPGPVPPSAR